MVLGLSAAGGAGCTSDADDADDTGGDPPAALTNVTHVDSEEACPQGATVTQTGADTNGNGVLDPDEVTSTTHMCASVIEGSFIVHNSLDAGALVGVTTITGDLTIDAPGLSALDLSALQTIGGAFNDNSFQPDLALPALTSVGGGMTLASGGVSAPLIQHTATLWITSAATAVHHFPSLLTTDLLLDDSRSTADLVLPALTHVENATLVSGRTVRAPALTSITTVELSRGGTLDMPAVTSIGTFTIDDNIAGTSAVSLPALTEVTTKLVVNYVGTTSLSFPALARVGALTVTECPHVTLQTPVLAHAGAITLVGPADDTGSLAWAAPALADAARISIAHFGTYTSALVFPALTHVDANIGVWNLPTLQSISLPALATIGGAVLPFKLDLADPAVLQPGHLPVLATISAPVLTHMGGTLIVGELPALTSVNLPALATIDGGLQLGAELPATAQFPLPALAYVGGEIYIGGAFSTYTLPNLASAGALRTGYAGSLATLSLPRLTTITGPLQITDTTSLTTVSAPLLTAIGSLTVDRAPVLSSLPLSKLQTVTGELRISEGVIPAFDLSALTTVGGALQIEPRGPVSSVLAPHLTAAGTIYLSATTVALDALATVTGDVHLTVGTQTASLPALTTVGGGLRIQGGDVRHVTAPHLTALTGVLDLSFNSRLPVCEVVALAAQSRASGYNAAFDDAAATCP